MEKLVEFGRRAMFYVRVLSGYEERRIRSYRLQIQQRLAKAEERKAALRKIPEQVILSEVRRMVEEMQSLNKKLEETSNKRNEGEIVEKVVMLVGPSPKEFGGYSICIKDYAKDQNIVTVYKMLD